MLKVCKLFQVTEIDSVLHGYQAKIGATQGSIKKNGCQPNAPLNHTGPSHSPLRANAPRMLTVHSRLADRNSFTTAATSRRFPSTS